MHNAHKGIVQAEAQFDGQSWRFTLADDAAEPLLLNLIQGGFGVSGLSLQRPGLHDAFVRIVQDAKAADAQEAQPC
ncbi:MAG: hypothetical protein ACK440_11115 [Sphingomonadaceae bacterium]